MKKLILIVFSSLVLFGQASSVVRNGGTAASGSGTAYTCAYAIAPAAYITGALYTCKMDVANTSTTPTINFNSLGAKTIVKPAGGATTALALNDIRIGQGAIFMYDGTNMQLVSLLGNAPGAGGGCSPSGSNNNILTDNGSGGCTSNSAVTIVGGDLFAAGNAAHFSSMQATYFQDFSATQGYWQTNVSGYNWVNVNRLTTSVNTADQAAASQTADLHQNLSSSSAVLSGVTVAGIYYTPAILIEGTKFTTSGCSVSSTTGGATAGVFTLGANTCNVVITMNGATGVTAPNGWHCDANDRTTPTVLIGGESSSTTTTATIAIPAGAGSTNVISFACVGF